MHNLQLPGQTKPYVMAHRGNRVRFPENTLSAFKQAIQDGADILETDLHLTSDGEVVCIHDNTVDRTTNGNGRVDDLTLPELRRLNAATDHPNLEPEPVPTLTELANLLPANLGLAVELKDEAFFRSENAKLVTDLLQEAGVRARTVALSFHVQHLEAVRQADPEIPVGLITLSKPYPAPEFDMLGPFWPLLVINPFFVWWAHRRGQVVCPLDPTPEARIWYYKLLGCDALLTDDPEKTCRALGRGEAKTEITA